MEVSICKICSLYEKFRKNASRALSREKSLCIFAGRNVPRGAFYCNVLQNPGFSPRAKMRALSGPEKKRLSQKVNGNEDDGETHVGAMGAY
ncbi:MAG: hypothetical protein MSS85_05815 [Pyramidobacter sp.]|nr:hypothetical protein [Pyramidobacter sp.]